MTAFVPLPSVLTALKPLPDLSWPKRPRGGSVPPPVTCARRPPSPSRAMNGSRTSKKKTSRSRPSITTPPPPSQRVEGNVSRGRGGPAELVRKALRSRRDALVVGAGIRGKLSAALSARERSEHALVLVPTRSEARRAAAEIHLDARGSTVILAAGEGGGSWAHPAMNANSSLKAAIVVATPRALVAEFCDSPHGRPWLGNVRFLAVVDPNRLVDTGCQKLLRRILRAMRVKDHRKNVVMCMRPPEDDVKKLVESLLRDMDKVVTLNWGMAVPPLQLLQTEELRNDQRLQYCGQFYVSSTVAGVYTSLSAMLHAHIEKDGKHKLVVFFPTARLAEYFALLFRGRGFEVLDVHGKTALGKKEQFLEAFYSVDKAIVFSSDTLARDALLPPIDEVVQIGIPASAEQYLRRVALVADGGEGRCAGLLLLHTEAEAALNIVGEVAKIERRQLARAEDWRIDRKDDISPNAKARAYVSWLAYYRRCRRKIGWDRPELVRQANVWAMGALGEVPTLDKKVIDRLFLRGIDGIKCTSDVTVK